jgi:predicted transcriptional regulator
MEVDAEGHGPQAEKRQFLVVIDAEVIRRTKILAIERRVPASSLVQRALVDFLDREAAAPAAQDA